MYVACSVAEIFCLSAAHFSSPVSSGHDCFLCPVDSALLSPVSSSRKDELSQFQLSPQARLGGILIICGGSFFLKLFILFLALLVLCGDAGFCLVAVSGSFSFLQRKGFSLWWLLVVEHGS